MAGEDRLRELREREEELRREEDRRRREEEEKRRRRKEEEDAEAARTQRGSYTRPTVNRQDWKSSFPTSTLGTQAAGSQPQEEFKYKGMEKNRGTTDEGRLPKGSDGESGNSTSSKEKKDAPKGNEKVMATQGSARTGATQFNADKNVSVQEGQRNTSHSKNVDVRTGAAAQNISSDRVSVNTQQGQQHGKASANQQNQHGKAAVNQHTQSASSTHTSITQSQVPASGQKVNVTTGSGQGAGDASKVSVKTQSPKDQNTPQKSKAGTAKPSSPKNTGTNTKAVATGEGTRPFQAAGRGSTPPPSKIKIQTKSPKDQNVNKDNHEPNGVYKKAKTPDGKPIDQVTKNTIENQYKDSEARQGRMQMQHIGSLYGFGTISRGVSKADLEHIIYKQNDRTAAEVNKILGGSGQLYAGNIRTGSVVNDYYSNVATLERALASRNINAKNLTPRQIDDAIRSGELSHFYSRVTGTNKVKLDDDTKTLLKALGDYKRQGERVEQFKKMNGGAANTAKAWIKETVRNSDAYEGYQVAKVTATVGKVGIKGAKKAVEGTAKAGIGIVATTHKAYIGGQKISNKWAFHQTGDTKFLKINADLDKGIKRVNSRASAASKGVSAVANFSPTGFVTGRISALYNGAISRIPVLRRIRPIRNALKNNIVARIIRKPFSLLNSITRTIKKMLLKACLGVAGIVLLCTLALAIIPIIFPDAGVEIEKGKGETELDTNGQKMIDYLYSYQEAYTENCFEADADSIWADKGIPDSWRHQITAVDSTLDNAANNASVYKEDTFIGFNFLKYWGQRAWWEIPESGKDMSEAELRPIYYTYITGTWPEGDEDGYTYMQSHTVTLKFYGNAGLSGDIGEYSIADIKDLYYSGINELEFNINGGDENPGTESEAYNLWAEKLNEDVDLTFNYYGSRFTYTVTGDKYSSYYNSVNTRLAYDIDIFYKGFLTICLAFTDNSNENADFYTLYAKELFDAIMENATVTLVYEYIPEEVENNLKATIKVDDSDVEVYCNDYYKCHVSVNIRINDSGIMDMIYMDSILEAVERDGSVWTHHDEAGNDWAHFNDHTFFDIENGRETGYPPKNHVRSTTIYDQQNAAHDDYNMWFTEQVGENVNPKWGMSEEEKNGTNALEEMTYYDGLPRLYTKKMLTCIEYYQLSVRDWEDMLDGLTFPSGWGRMMNDAEIAHILEAALTYNPVNFADMEEDLAFILSTIGRFSYNYGQHAGNWETYTGRGFDCSGYISYLLQAMGRIPNGAYYTAGGYANGDSGYAVTGYFGDSSSLNVGDLLVKNRTYGTSEGSSNHVVMYVGMLQLEGDEEPREYVIECSSGRNGVVLTPVENRAYFQYVVHTG